MDAGLLGFSLEALGEKKNVFAPDQKSNIYFSKIRAIFGGKVSA
jgi:hypothetical protein